MSFAFCSCPKIAEWRSFFAVTVAIGFWMVNVVKCIRKSDHRRSSGFFRSSEAQRLIRKAFSGTVESLMEEARGGLQMKPWVSGHLFFGRGAGRPPFLSPFLLFVFFLWGWGGGWVGVHFKGGPFFFWGGWVPFKFWMFGFLDPCAECPLCSGMMSTMC